jgi:class 3 adenylate cyclase
LGSRGVEQLTAHLNEYFVRMIDLIHNHGGDIVKFAGDALLAIWPSLNGSFSLHSHIFD